MEQRLSGIQYRPSIDGMRAIAVLAVLAFHLDKRLLPGGFVGVDVFFVISGYLITSIIYDASQSNSFSISRFYQRRISRIFPVLFAVTIATLLAASVLYTSRDFAAAGAMATASVLSVANFKLMLQGDYFEVTPDSQPFLHFWSLSVEEQFYIFLPVLLVLTQRYRLSRSRMLVLLSFLAATSFIACLYVTHTKPTWAFYLLPTRAWELLSGAILAVVASKSDSSSPRIKDVQSLIGLLLIVASMFLISESQAFPGYVALLPVAGSVLLIGRSHYPTQFTERLLSRPWMVTIGKLSYSLYLWHWPVYCFVDYRLFSETTVVRIGWKIAITALFAIASYFLIEKRCRSFLNKSQNMRLGFLGFSAGVTALAIAGYAIRADNHVDSSPRSVAKGGVAFDMSRFAPRIVLMGDSNGSMYGVMIKTLSSEDGFNVNVISVDAGNPFPGNQLYDASLNFLEVSKPDVTVFVAAWASRLEKDTNKLNVALEGILRHSTYVVLITQPPILPEVDYRKIFRNRGVEPIFEDPSVAELRRRTNDYLSSLQSDRVKIVQIDSLFEEQNGEIVFRDEFGRQLFQDKTHLSGFGAQLVKVPLFKTIHRLLNGKKREPSNALRAAERASSSSPFSPAAQ